jgi:hypothetical protein
MQRESTVHNFSEIDAVFHERGAVADGLRPLEGRSTSLGRESLFTHLFITLEPSCPAPAVPEKPIPGCQCCGCQQQLLFLAFYPRF